MRFRPAWAAAALPGLATFSTCSRIFWWPARLWAGAFPIGTFTTRKDLIPDGLEFEAWHMLTFMNQPLAAAAGLAVLDIIEKEDLVERARILGAEATEWFRQLARRFDVIGDVRGPGFFIGVDFVEDRRTKVPATAACRKAWDFALDHGLITQFGGIGGNVLKFKPPLTTPEADFKRMLEISADMVAFIQREVDQQRAKVASAQACRYRGGCSPAV